MPKKRKPSRSSHKKQTKQASPHSASLNLFKDQKEHQTIARILSQDDNTRLASWMATKPSAALTTKPFQIDIAVGTKKVSLMLNIFEYALILNSVKCINHLAPSFVNEIKQATIVLLNKPYSYLQFVCRYLSNNQAMMEVLINHGADINQSIEDVENNATLTFLTWLTTKGFNWPFIKKVLSSEQFCKGPTYEICSGQKLNTLNFLTDVLCTLELKTAKTPAEKTAVTATKLTLMTLVKSKMSHFGKTIEIDPSDVKTRHWIPEIIAIQTGAWQVLKFLIERCHVPLDREFKSYDNALSNKTGKRFPVIDSLVSMIIKLMSELDSKNLLDDNLSTSICDIVDYLLSKELLKNSELLTIARISGNIYSFKTNLLMVACADMYNPEIVNILEKNGIDPFVTVELSNKIATVNMKNDRTTRLRKTVAKNENIFLKITSGDLDVKSCLSAFRMVIESEDLAAIRHLFTYMKRYYDKYYAKSAPDKWHEMLQESFYILLETCFPKKNANEYNKKLENILEFLFEQGLVLHKDYGIFKKYDICPLSHLMLHNWPLSSLNMVVEKVHQSGVKQLSEIYNPSRYEDTEIKFTPLIAAAYKNVEYFKWLLDTDPTYNYSDIDEIIAMTIYLLDSGQISLFSRILPKVKASFYEDIFMRSMLHTSADKISMMNLMLDEKFLSFSACVEICFEIDEQHIVALLTKENLKLLNGYCSHGDFKRFPLYMLALHDESGSVIQKLLQLGFNPETKFVNPKTKQSTSFLEFALCANDRNVLVEILKFRNCKQCVIADIQKGTQPLYAAVKAHDKALVDLFLAHGQVLKAADLEKMSDANIGFMSFLHNKMAKSPNKTSNRHLLSKSFLNQQPLKRVDIQSLAPPKQKLTRKNTIIMLHEIKQQLQSAKKISGIQLALIESFNLFEYLAGNKIYPGLDAIYFRETLNILMHRYDGLTKVECQQLIDRVAIPLIDKLLEKQPMNSPEFIKELTTFARQHPPQAVEPSDRLNTLEDYVKQLSDLGEKVTNGSILYVNQPLFAKAKLLLIRIGEWVQKNNAGLKDTKSLQVEYGFLARCKEIRTIASHDQMCTSTVLKMLDPYDIFQTIQFSCEIDMQMSFKNKRSSYADAMRIQHCSTDNNCSSTLQEMKV